MTQKIELIKAEIERLKKAFDTGSSSEAKYRYEAYNELLDFINSLPKEPKFKVGDMVVSTHNPSLTYKVLQVGLPNELGKLDYEVEIYTDGKAGMKVGDRFIEHNIHLISCDKMDEWGNLIPEEPVSKELEEAAVEYCQATTTINNQNLKDEVVKARISDFKAGAQWQKKQSEEPVSKDLEELAISLEETIGTSPHSRDTIIEYFEKAVQWQKEYMIEKACEWLTNHNDYICGGTNGWVSFDMTQLVKDFKKAMEDKV